MKRAIALIITIPFIWILFHTLSDGAVLTPGNMVNLFKYLTVVGILSTGMTFVMAAGHIDLSVGSGLGLLGALNALFIYNLHWPLAVALVVSMLLAILMGLLHGSLVAYLKVPAFIVTLSGLMAYMGLKQFFANPVIPIHHAGLLFLGQGYLSHTLGFLTAGIFSALLFAKLWSNRRNQKKYHLPFYPMWSNALLFIVGAFSFFAFILVCNYDRGLPFCVLLMILMGGVCHGIATRTRFGRHVFAIGSNSEAAEYAGISLSFHTVGVFVLLALLTWIAGLVATSQLMAAAADIGDYQELYAIAACVIGGTSLRGGSGNVWMSLLGALLMASILNGMEQVGIASTLQKVILGLILTASVALDQLLGKKSR